MRAVVLREGRLQVRETPDPRPGPGELLLRTLSTAICASDAHFIHHPELAVDDPTGRSLYDTKQDIVLGHEFVGEVIGHGPGCTDQFSVGTRVTALPIRLLDGGAGGVRIIGQHPEAQGSFAELLVVSEVAAKPVAGDVSFDAAALADFAVGEFYVRSANIQPARSPWSRRGGDRPVRRRRPGRRGVEPIVASDYKSERRALARDGFGAHVVVDPGGEVSVRRVQRGAREQGLPGPAVVFECVGAPGLIQKIVESAEMGTRIYCAGGWYTGDTLDITTATRQGVTIQFGGGPHPQDWYGTLDAIASGTAGPVTQCRQDHRPRPSPRCARTGPPVRRSAAHRRRSQRRHLMSERDDRQDISEVLVRYATGIDRRDWPLFRTVFAADCQLDYGEIGTWQGSRRCHRVHGRNARDGGAHPAPPDQPDHRGRRRKASSRTYVDAVIMFGDNGRRQRDRLLRR